MQTEIKPQRNMAIDFIRAICILYIVGFWHLFNYTEAFPKSFVSNFNVCTASTKNIMVCNNVISVLSYI